MANSRAVLERTDPIIKQADLMEGANPEEALKHQRPKSSRPYDVRHSDPQISSTKQIAPLDVSRFDMVPSHGTFKNGPEMLAVYGAKDTLRTNLFAETQFGRLLRKYPAAAIDIGSRGGIEPNLLPIAFGIDAIGFEPDPEALTANERHHRGPWRTVRFLPYALASEPGTRTLSIPIHSGAASVLTHNQTMGRRFNKPEYFNVVSTIPVQTHRLDDVTPDSVDPAFMKIDVEGFEFDILQGASRILDRCVALKLEVAFLPLRVDQPLASDIEVFLRSKGFEFFDLMSLARWRMYDRTHKWYSKAQLVHADFLFFRNADALPSPVKRFEAAAIAMTYGYFDHAALLLTQPSSITWLKQEGVDDPFDLIKEAAAQYSKVEHAINHVSYPRRVWRFASRIGKRMLEARRPNVLIAESRPTPG